MRNTTENTSLTSVLRPELVKSGPEVAMERVFGVLWPVGTESWKRKLKIYGSYDELLELGLNGIERWEALRDVILETCPWVVWHSWADLMVQSWCQYNELGWAGSGAAGKTYLAGVFSFIDYLVSPNKTATIMTTTSKWMARKRVWGAIEDCHRHFSKNICYVGDLVQSQLYLRPSEDDTKHGIFVLAVESGETDRALGKLIGIHAERVRICIDECPDTPSAILDATINLRKGAKEFKLVMMGNPNSRLDCFGRRMQPVQGWANVDIDTDFEWNTLKYKGRCIRFDAYHGPNWPETKFHFLQTAQDIKDSEENEGTDSPAHLRFCRAWWQSVDERNHIFSEQIFIKHDVGEHVWLARPELLCGVDLSFSRGGDDTMMTFGLLGDLVGGGKGLQMTDQIKLKLSGAGGADAIHFQLEDKVHQECDKRGVIPSNCALDSTSEGDSICSLLKKSWGEVVGVEFGGAASRKPVSRNDSKPSHTRYDNRVSELWFRCRELCIAGVLKGFSPRSMREFCAREYQYLGKKIRVEPKDILKKRIGCSPDAADSVAVLVDLAVTRGLIGRIGRNDPATRKWRKFKHKMHSIYDNGSSPSDNLITNDGLINPA